ncbi:NAD/NADP octopine/nopaline dehydrogenase family protein [Salinicoccus kekensis]|uniref:6-phosphogluconate dehydrogenase, decarboxylating n=1 Tax=Salinicoccus kekensis TaxID=714307 RepID=A0A285UGR7_9STAP|nr:NAD/NADP octopine/nopaline dehydrogenase family protein [Salinicoccus kekensis]SOC40953.1 opine dehydrogenase [Salinicoccus kekensis]
MKVSIIGAGNGGIVAAADLTEKGHEVTLYHSKNALKDPHPNIMEGHVGFKGRLVRFQQYTQDPKLAVADADVIMTCLPTNALLDIFKEISPHLKDGQMIYINGASSMFSILIHNYLKETRPELQVYVGESMSLTYAARYDYMENEAAVILYSHHNLFSAYPAADTKVMLEKLDQLYDCFVPAKNIMEPALNNGNPESHPAPAILNTGFIDNRGDEFYLYKDGVTEHTIKVIEEIDMERQGICRALGLDAVSKAERSVRSKYFRESESLQEQYNTSPILKDLPGPSSLENRYIVEDVTNGLMLWKSIAEAVKVKTPTIDSIIHLTRLMLDEKYFHHPLTLERLGLDAGRDLNAQV